MKKTVTRVSSLFLAFFLFLFSSCSTTANIDKSWEITANDNFYVYIYDDPINLAEQIIEVFEKNDLKVEPVYNQKFVPQGKTEEISGTGFFISPSVIVTSWHLVRNETDITYYINGSPHHASPLFVDANSDLAFLLTEENDNPYFALGSKEDYSMLTSVYSLGYPLNDVLGNTVKVTYGISGIDEGTIFLQLSARLQPGSNGGPIVNQDFKVVAVANSKLSDIYMMNNKGTLVRDVDYAIKSDIVSFFASEYIPDEKHYVSNLGEAMNATVKIEAVGTEIIEGKQYGIDFSYRYNFDLIHWTLTDLKIFCYDMESGDKIADARFSGDSIMSGKGIAKMTTRKLLKAMGLTVSDDEE